ncbi:MAG: hypothetical protein ABI693_05195 [Bryobacteraceae bacterium]
MEIRSDALPSAVQRNEVAVATEKAWRQRQENDPVLDRMTLGFAIAIVLLTAWWNLQPIRVMRFWLKPPYKPLTFILFRLFFAANLVGAISHLVAAVNQHQRPTSEYVLIAGIAAALIAAIWVMATVVLRLGRRQDQAR